MRIIFRACYTWRTWRGIAWSAPCGIWAAHRRGRILDMILRITDLCAIGCAVAVKSFSSQSRCRLIFHMQSEPFFKWNFTLKFFRNKEEVVRFLKFLVYLFGKERCWKRWIFSHLLKAWKSKKTSVGQNPDCRRRE